ncbi:MAG: choice-of-anchor D domain-containing protein [Hyphomicrobiales bacterium]
MKYIATIVLVFASFLVNAQTTIEENFESNAFLSDSNWEVFYDHENIPDANKITISDTEAHNGNNSIKFCSFEESQPYDEYLISPPLNLSTTSTLTFWYKKNKNSTEVFRVGWSNKGNNTKKDFKWTDNIFITNNDWHQFKIDNIPQNTKHISIHYKSECKYYMFIDDLKMFPSTNMYIDNVETSFPDKNTILQNATDELILKLKVNTIGTLNKRSIQNLTFNLDQSTSINDIKDLKLYYLNENQQAPKQLLAHQTNITTNPSFNINQKLHEGTNSFLLTLSLNENAHPNNIINAVCSSYTINNDIVNVNCNNNNPRTITEGLKGTFIIGRTSDCDYNSFENAIQDLEENGISGNVILKVKEGAYSESLIINKIKGTSANSKILFTPFDDNSTVTISSPYNNHNNSSTIHIKNSDHIEINGFKIYNNYSKFCIRISEAANNITINNNNFIYESNSALRGDNYVINIETNENENAGSNIMIKNNLFQSAKTSIYAITENENSSNLKILNNKFTQDKQSCIFIKKFNAPTINNNTITLSSDKNEASAIELLYNKGKLTSNNNTITIKNTAADQEIYAYYIYRHDNPLDDFAIIANNFISIESNDSKPSAIYIENSGKLLIAHNTTHIHGNGDKSICLNLNHHNQRISIFNNIFHNNTMGISIFMKKPYYASEYICDNNNIFSKGYSICKIDRTVVNRLESWVSSINNDFNSIKKEVTFESDTNLHILSRGLTIGKFLPKVALDIENEPRSKSSVYIGADQHNHTDNIDVFVDDTKYNTGELLSFGEIYINQEYKKNLRLVNNSNKHRRIELLNQDEVIFSENNFTLQSGESKTIELSLTPEAIGTYNRKTALKLCFCRDFNINIDAKVTYPPAPIFNLFHNEQTVSDNQSFDFGEKLESEENNKQFVIKNTGNADLSVNFTLTDDFIIDKNNLTISPDQSETINIRTNRTSIGDKNTTLIINHNAGDPIQINLHGKVNPIPYAEVKPYITINNTPTIIDHTSSINLNEINREDEIELTIKNTGNVNLTGDLSIDGNFKIDDQNLQLDIEPKQSKIFILTIEDDTPLNLSSTVSIENNSSIQNYTFNIEATVPYLQAIAEPSLLINENVFTPTNGADINIKTIPNDQEIKLKLYNSGNINLTGTIVIDGPFSIESPDFDIAADNYHEFNITFNEDIPLEFSGTFTIENNSDEGAFLFNISGNFPMYAILSPSIIIDNKSTDIENSSTVDLGELNAEEYQLTIDNNGNIDLTGNINVSGDFNIDDETINIKPEESRTFILTPSDDPKIQLSANINIINNSEIDDFNFILETQRPLYSEIKASITHNNTEINIENDSDIDLGQTEYDDTFHLHITNIGNKTLEGEITHNTDINTDNKIINIAPKQSKTFNITINEDIEDSFSSKLKIKNNSDENNYSFSIQGKLPELFSQINASFLHNNKKYNAPNNGNINFGNINSDDKIKLQVQNTGNKNLKGYVFINGDFILSNTFLDLAPEQVLSFDVQIKSDRNIERNGELIFNNNSDIPNFITHVKGELIDNIVDLSAHNITISPNPARNKLFIKCDNKLSPLTISIYTVHGKKVINTNNSNMINVSSLKDGAYIIHINNDSINARGKFIKVNK